MDLQVIAEVLQVTISAIPIRGDGSGGVASVVINFWCCFTSATITTAGTGYTYAYIRNADIITATNAGGAGSGGNHKCNHST